MKVVKKITIMFAVIAMSLVSYAESREKYSVTGKSGTLNLFYHEIAECIAAAQDAIDKANGKCREEGLEFYVLINQEPCSNRLFGGKELSMTFYCEL